MAFFTFSTMKTVDDHCGYALPFDPLQYFFWNNAGYHDVHHQGWGIKVRYLLSRSCGILTNPLDKLLTTFLHLLGSLARNSMDWWRRVGSLRCIPRESRRATRERWDCTEARGKHYRRRSPERSKFHWLRERRGNQWPKAENAERKVKDAGRRVETTSPQHRGLKRITRGEE